MSSIEDDWDIPLRRAIRAAGGVAALAKAVGVSAPAIYAWRRAPVHRVAAIERATGVPRHVLRPDLWDAPVLANTPNSPAAAG